MITAPPKLPPKSDTTRHLHPLNTQTTNHYSHEIHKTNNESILYKFTPL